MIEISVKFFGAMKGSLPQEMNELRLHLKEGARVSDLRAILEAELDERRRKVLGDSAIADERRVLSESDPLREMISYAVLPPVCGG